MFSFVQRRFKSSLIPRAVERVAVIALEQQLKAALVRFINKHFCLTGNIILAFCFFGIFPA